MATLEIPLTAENQTLDVTLAGVDYRLAVTWRGPKASGSWYLDIASADGTPLVNGIPLVTGADLLAQYAYLGIGGQLIVQSDFDPDQAPTFENLGDVSHLYFVTP